MATPLAVARRAKKKGARVGLSLLEEERLKAKLRVTYPSEPWVDHSVRRFEDTKADGETIVYRFFDPKAFPINADTTPMVVCPKCSRTVPANSLEGGICMDHRPKRVHNAYGSSPSANAILMIQHYKLRIRTVKLKKESNSALKREIARHLSGAWTKSN